MGFPFQLSWGVTDDAGLHDTPLRAVHRARKMLLIVSLDLLMLGCLEPSTRTGTNRKAHRMKSFTTAIVCAAASLVLSTGCDKATTDSTTPTVTDESMTDISMFGMPEIVELGTVDINGTILVVTMTGSVTPGEGLSLELTHTDGPKPTIMKAWVGTESGEGSKKDTGHSHGEELPIIWHTYAECPTAMTDDMQLWLTLTYEDGSEGTGKLTIQQS